MANGDAVDIEEVFLKAGHVRPAGSRSSSCAT